MVDIASLALKLDDASFKAALGRTLNDLGKFKKETEGADRAVSKLEGTAVRSFGGIKTAVAAVVGGIGFGALTSGVVNTIRSFEDLQARLKTLTGSAENGAKAFEMITKFAATTPFELEDVTRGFARLRTVGIDATAETLKNLGNVAAAFGSDFGTFAEATADAVTGEFERLKEFGMVVSKQGDQLAITMDGQTKTIQNSATSIKRFLEDLGRTKYSSGIENQAATVSGAFSNLQDAFKLLAYEIGEGGLKQALGDVARDLATFVGTNKEAAREIGANLGAALRTAGEMFKFLASNIDIVVIAMKAMLGVGLVLLLANVTAAVRTLIASFVALNAVMSANKVLVIAASLAAIGGALYGIASDGDDATDTLKQTQAILDRLKGTNLPLAEQFAAATAEMKLAEAAAADLKAKLADQSWLQSMNPFGEDLSGQYDAATAKAQAYANVLKNLREQIEAQKPAVQANTAAADEAKIKAEANTAAIQKWIGEAQKLTGKLEENKAALATGADATDQFRLAQQFAKLSMEGVSGETLKQAQALLQNNNALDAAVTKGKTAADSASDLASKQKSFSDSLADTRRELEAEIATFGMSASKQEAYKLNLQAEALGQKDATSALREKVNALREELAAKNTGKGVSDYIENLKEETRLLRMGNQERAIAQNLRAAGDIAKNGGRSLTQTEIDDLKAASILKAEAEIADKRREEATQKLTQQSTELERARQLEIERSVELQIRAEEQLKESFSRVGDAIADMVEAGKFSVRTLIAEFIRLFATQALTRSTWAGGNGGLTGGLAAGAIRGLRATGGNVMGGSSYVVGERGPEIFTPSSAGMITPNNRVSGGGSGAISIINSPQITVQTSPGADEFATVSLLKDALSAQTNQFRRVLIDEMRYGGLLNA